MPQPFLQSWDPNHDIQIITRPDQPGLVRVQHHFGEDIVFNSYNFSDRTIDKFRNARIFWSGDVEFLTFIFLTVRSVRLFDVTVAEDPVHGLTYEQCKDLTLAGPKHTNCVFCGTLQRVSSFVTRRTVGEPKSRELRVPDSIKEGEEVDSDATITPYP